jgi:hypothetical protein
MATKPIPKLPLLFVYRSGARAVIDGGDKPASRGVGTISNGRSNIENAAGTRLDEGCCGGEKTEAGNGSVEGWDGPTTRPLGLFGSGNCFSQGNNGRGDSNTDNCRPFGTKESTASTPQATYPTDTSATTKLSPSRTNSSCCHGDAYSPACEKPKTDEYDTT